MKRLGYSVAIAGGIAVSQFGIGVVAADPGAGGAADGRPVVVIGASISTGSEVSGVVAYPRMISAIAGRSVFLSARGGAGYADGSIAGLAQAANLAERNPSLVVIQAGSNDIGAAAATTAAQVRQVVSTVRRQVPAARIALITVFPTIRGAGPAAEATDATIVGAARAADPTVSVISPLGEGWTYKPGPDGHPDAATHQKLAERVAALA